MATQVDGIRASDGYAVGTLDAMGAGYGFRKVRRALGVTAFGVNALVIPPGFFADPHFHDEQEELYFVHRGRLEIAFGDGESFTLGEGGMARVDAATVRRIGNPGPGDCVCLVAGGAGGYVGRDGRTAGETQAEGVTS